MQTSDNQPQGTPVTDASRLAPQSARESNARAVNSPCRQCRSKDADSGAAHQTCFFVQALDAVESGVLIGSRIEGKYVYANAYAQRLLAEVPESLSFHRLLTSDPTGFGDPLEHHGAIESATRMIVKEAGRAIGLCLYQSRTQPDLTIIQLKDISAERESRQFATNASDARMVTRIFSQLRHEIGNPLNSIKMSLQVLKENLDDFPKPKVLAYITRCVGEVRRLERLLASLREFSRENRPVLREIDLKSQLGRFAELSRAQCESAQVELSVTVDERARFAMADTEALDQVLHNLLLNAIQAKRQELGHLSVRTRRGMRQDQLVIEMEDDGVGISRHMLSLVFRPMFTTKTEGTGLGLALVERLMNGMGGMVTIESEENRYTRVVLTLIAGDAI